MAGRMMHLGMSIRGLGNHPAARCRSDMPADVAYAAHATIEADKAYCDVVKGCMAKYNRDPDTF